MYPFHFMAQTPNKCLETNELSNPEIHRGIFWCGSQTIAVKTTIGGRKILRIPPGSTVLLKSTAKPTIIIQTNPYLRFPWLCQRSIWVIHPERAITKTDFYIVSIIRVSGPNIGVVSVDSKELMSFSKLDSQRFFGNHISVLTIYRNLCGIANDIQDRNPTNTHSIHLGYKYW